MKRFTLSFLLAVLFFLSTVSAQEQELRTWKAATGEFSLQAKLIEKKGESIVLEKQDGKRITVVLDLLSVADQQYVAERNDQSAAHRKRKRNTGEMDYGDVVTLQADKAIPWQAIVASVETRNKTDLKAPVSLDVEGSFAGPRSNRLISNPSGDKLLLVTRNDNSAELHVYDLASDNPKATKLQLPANCTPLAISDNNRSLIVVPGSGRRGSVVWLNPSGSGVRERLVWRYTPSRIAELILAEFVGDGLLVTADTVGMISMWDLHARSLLWQIESRRSLVPAISHDLKTLVSCNDRHLFQIDLQKGEVVGCLPVTIGEPACFGFLPNGKEIICYGSNSTRRIDVSNGETLEQWSCQGKPRCSILCWPNDHQFVINGYQGFGFYVIDTRLRGEVGSYTRSDGVASDRRNRVWSLVSNGTEKSIECIEAPHEYYSSWCEQQNPDDFVIIKPGDSIRLEVSAVVHDATKSQIANIREIREEFSERVNGGRRGSRAGSRGNNNPEQDAERLRKSLQHVVVDSVDCSDEVYNLMAKKIEGAGLVVSDSAEYTLHVEIGHPDEISTVNGAGPTHVPYTIRYHAFATDSDGNRIWKTMSQTYTALDASDHILYSTVTADSIKYLEELDIPGHFVKFRARGYSALLNGRIQDEDFKK